MKNALASAMCCDSHRQGSTAPGARVSGGKVARKSEQYFAESSVLCRELRGFAVFCAGRGMTEQLGIGPVLCFSGQKVTAG